MHTQNIAIISLDQKVADLDHLFAFLCWIHVSARLIRYVRINNRALKASARSNSPLEVSKTIAVVSTRVWPRIFPPTIIEAPTSEMTEPKPAINAAKSGRRASRHKCQTIR